MNIKFHYLYRDGGNYKQFHSEVFSNIKSHTLEEIESIITSALIEECWFDTDKWKLKDLHLYKWDNELDHMWHEFDHIEGTHEEATSGDVDEFIKIIQKTVN